MKFISKVFLIIILILILIISVNTFSKDVLMMGILPITLAAIALLIAIIRAK